MTHKVTGAPQRVAEVAPFRVVGTCCREWLLAAGFHKGRCGLCGQVPTFTRVATEDDYGQQT